jgi:SAM-dependent methyltransferase
MSSEPEAHAVKSLVDGRTFDACYYERYAGGPYRRSPEWLTFFAGIADRIAADIRPGRVLDAGCALGLLVEALRTKNIDAFGIDASAFAIAQVYEPIKSFCRQASVTDPLCEQYDLIVCLEVLEHMTAAEGETAIANFCAHTGDILFSSSPVHFGEATHVNTQPPEYWAAQFARHGFYRDVDFDASFVAPWAARFRRRTDPPHRIVADYERAFSRVVVERNELRIVAVATQAEISRLTEALKQAETARAEVAQALEQAETARAEVAQALEQAETARAEVAQALEQAETARAEVTQALEQAETARAELAQARATIDLMKRSWFWRARRPWEWLGRMLGRHQ